MMLCDYNNKWSTSSPSAFITINIRNLEIHGPQNMVSYLLLFLIVFKFISIFNLILDAKGINAVNMVRMGIFRGSGKALFKGAKFEINFHLLSETEIKVVHKNLPTTL